MSGLTMQDIITIYSVLENKITDIQDSDLAGEVWPQRQIAEMESTLAKRG